MAYIGERAELREEEPGSKVAATRVAWQPGMDAWRSCSSARGDGSEKKPGAVHRNQGRGRGAVARFQASRACTRARGHGAGELLAWAVEEEDGLALGVHRPVKEMESAAPRRFGCNVVQPEENGAWESWLSPWNSNLTGGPRQSVKRSEPVCDELISAA